MNRILLLLILLLHQPVLAQSYKRKVSFEWEPIANAIVYEVQLSPIKPSNDNPPIVYTAKEPAFNGKLMPGRYTMRLRSFDSREVPGKWSDSTTIDVPLDAVKLKTPAPKANLVAKDSREEKLSFEWATVGGAAGYLFELQSEDGKTQITEKLDVNHIELTLPVARRYTWKVNALGAEDLNSETVSATEFTLQGPQLQKPTIEKPENEYVREIKWTRPDLAENYDILIARYNRKNKKWETVKSLQNYAENQIQFDPSWSGGKYKMSLRAKGELRPSSAAVSESFDVRNGDRSPAAEYTGTLRKSIDRLNGWYGIASYLVTQMQYRSTYRFLDIAYNTIGGTGRLGVGWFGENNPWGFLTIVDYSGFLYQQKVTPFASLESSAIYRVTVGEKDEMRFHSGLYYKEIPLSIPDCSAVNCQTTPAGQIPVNSSMQSVAGPHLGFEYWFSMTPKLGLQVNTHAYYSLLKVSTPSGEPNRPGLSVQYGLLGSYRVKPNFTGLMGLTYRDDRAAYYDSSAVVAVPVSDLVETSIRGFYFSLFAEYAF